MVNGDAVILSPFLFRFDSCRGGGVKNDQNRELGVPLEAILYPLLLLALMWMMFWAERVSGYDLVRWGVRPQTLEGLKGILAMPLLHAPYDSAHIVNNSFPTALLLAALIYYYRDVALRVFVISWIGTGLGVWILAHDDHKYHIGMSGVIYALFGFLFISGFFRRYLPLQAISLFVVFLYGSMVWGIFPQKENISWEGHFVGLTIGVILAVVYRKKGPKGPKYQYEIEQELGIEPPDLEGIYNEQLAHLERQRLEQEWLAQHHQQHGPGHHHPTSHSHTNPTHASPHEVKIIYHVRPSHHSGEQSSDKPDESQEN